MRHETVCEEKFPKRGSSAVGIFPKMIHFEEVSLKQCVFSKKVEIIIWKSDFFFQSFQNFYLEK